MAEGDYAPKLKGRRVTFSVENECTCLSSPDGTRVVSESVPELESSQEEADSRIILHCCHQAATESSANGIIVRSPDTDVFLLLLYHSHNVGQILLFDTGSGNKRRLINITRLSEIHGQEKCEALLGLHALSGCDSTSSFVKKGKITALKTFEKQPKHLETFLSL